MEWMCETEECLVDQNLLDNLVQSQNYLDWIPGNYSQFWGKTLQEGQNGRLGTDSTLVRKSNSNKNVPERKKLYTPLYTKVQTN